MTGPVAKVVAANGATLNVTMPTPVVNSAQLFGFSPGIGPDSPDTMNATDLAHWMTLAYSLGARVVRLSADPADGVSAATTSRMVTAAKAAGLQVNLIFSHSTSASLVSSVVSTYYPLGVTRYEGNNEVNLNGVSPATWRTNNNAMYAAAKAAAPGCRWISGALASFAQYNTVSGGQQDPVSFLEEALVVGPLLCDRFGFHPYNNYGNTTAVQMLSLTNAYSGWGVMASLTHNLQKAFTTAGYTAPKIDATEWGAPSSGSTSAHPPGSLGANGPISYTEQANLMTQGIAQWKTFPWAGDLYVFTLRDLPDQPNADDQDFGIVNFDWSLKAAATAYQTAVG